MLKSVSYILFLLPILASFACGGNSDSEGLFSFSGTWSGRITQTSGASCSDGSFIGAGTGATSPTVFEVEISGIDRIDETGALSFEDCNYSGSREGINKVSFFSNEAGCFDTITVEILDPTTIRLSFEPSEPVAAPDGSVRCVASAAGDFEKTS